MFEPKFYYDPGTGDGGGNGDTIIKAEEVKEVKTPQEAVSFDKVEGDIFAKILEEPKPTDNEEKSPEQLASERADKISKFKLKEDATDEDISNAEKASAEEEKKNTPEAKEAERKEKIAKFKLKEDATDEDITAAERKEKIAKFKLKDDATDEDISAAEEAAENDTELKLEEGDDKKLGEEGDSNWVSVAKELNLEIKADSFEELKAAIIKDKNDAIEAERAKQYELSLKDYTPEAQDFIKFLDNEGTVEDFINPLKVYDEALAMSDEQLVEIDLKLKKWDDDKIKEQIEVLKESSTLEQTGYALRKQIELNKTAKSQQILKSQELKFQAAETKRLDDEKKENDAIKSVIDKTDEFLGGKLSKETKEALFKKHMRGDYRKRLASSPEDAVRTMLFLEFGEKQYKQIVKDTSNKTKEAVTKKLHNTKGEEKPGTKIPSTGKTFEAWDVIFGEQK